MKTLTHIGLALFAIFSLGTVTASAEDVPSGLSAYITAATNRVSTLSGLEFSVVVTNSATTNIIIHPWILKNGLGTVVVFNAQGLMMPYHPKPPIMTNPLTHAELPRDLALKPGESYGLKYKFGDRFFMATPPGKYRARGNIIQSNDVEITVE